MNFIVLKVIYIEIKESMFSLTSCMEYL